MLDRILELRRGLYEEPTRTSKEQYLRLAMYGLFSVPAIEGFVVVAQMVRSMAFVIR
ncbi:hypothetical protein B0T24DRAFT_719397 [Lasiosphaeria ovina]|uniref:Uncharacterized protein n=1 Tax=Lasiosphaeria ovina TaxID=92902 RepID=A0AAE0NC48_9PEZI|nr:hypothetical protein B0T24DRAFT_719397 [Lasiosphaeria ovina]